MNWAAIIWLVLLVVFLISEAATVTMVFLWFLAGPMIEKLDRIKVKYGLVE